MKSFTSSLGLIATNFAYRCDAKFADEHTISVLNAVHDAGSFQLNDFLPNPFVKGIQPNYIDQPTEESIPVVNTLSIQNLSLRIEDCRHITPEDFELISDERRLRKGDVLLTVDGGVSIGKPYLFDRTEDFTMDSHVVALRPIGISPLAFVYLLASPLGQIQFNRAESGASGQTTVTEDDVRRFIFPTAILETIDHVVTEIEKERSRIFEERRKLDKEEAALWQRLGEFTS